MMKTLTTGVCDPPSFRRFSGAGAVEEYHMVVHCEGTGGDIADALEACWLDALDEAGISPQSTILRRVFCSDVANQQPMLEGFAKSYPGAFSTIGQPPLNGAKLSMWSYHITDPGNPPVGIGGSHSYVVERGPLRHAWSSGLCDIHSDAAHQQSLSIMEKLDHWLGRESLTLRDDVIRTWWFVRDIDADYQALVEARKAVFEKHGLTKNTHFIASTGIAGAHHEPVAKLSLDTYAIGGLIPGQIEFISAPEHLGPTHRYGVTFERATAVSYSDRKHIFISGTASINPAGDILHPGDVSSQLERAIENVAALLDSAEAGLNDLASMIVYVRDPADGPVVEERLIQHFAETPMAIVHAPVCRPGWLVEIEGIACIPSDNPDFPAF